MNTGVLLWTGWQKSPMALAFNPDGTLLASGGLDGTVRLWDPKTGMNRQALQHPGNIFAVAFSPDGHLLASGCFDGNIRLWEEQKTALASYVEIRSIQTTWITDLAFAPDGRTLASCGNDGAIMIWNLETTEHLQTLCHDRPYERLNITGIRGLTEAQKDTLKILGAFEESL